MADLLGKRAHVDRLSSHPAKPASSSQSSLLRAVMLIATTPGQGSPARAASRRVHAIHVGKPEVHQDHVWPGAPGRARSPARPSSAPERPEPRRAQDFEASSRFLRYRRHRGRWSQAYPRAISVRLVIAEDHLFVREGIRRLLEADPEARGRRSDLDCSPRWRRSVRTWSSPTSACRPATATKGSGRQIGSAPPIHT